MANKTTTNKQSNKNIKNDDKYKETSSKRFAQQRSSLFKPNIISFLIESALVITLIIMDSPAIVFDDTSALFTYMLIITAAIPLINLIIILLANKTTQLLITMTLSQLTILPLIIGFVVKYEEMKVCSSYHMLIFYFLFMIAYLVITTSMFSLKARKFNSLEEK